MPLVSGFTDAPASLWIFQQPWRRSSTAEEVIRHFLRSTSLRPLHARWRVAFQSRPRSSSPVQDYPHPSLSVADPVPFWFTSLPARRRLLPEPLIALVGA